MHPQEVAQANVAKKFQVTIVYNGIEKPLEIESHAEVKSILARAIQLFGITGQPHLLSLFRADGTKVNEGQSASAAGLDDTSVLYLRQDAVKGGSVPC